MTNTADPLKVNCGVCSEVCKRGVKVTCCNARACRNCAVKHITKNKTCWKSACKKVVTTDDVVNDEELRALVDSLEDSEPISCTICGEICKRGVILSCCKAPCCRSCGVKKVTADRKCWMEACGALGLKSDDLENDDLLRSAVDHYKNNGAMDPIHLNTLKQRQEKNVDNTDSSKDNGKESDEESMEEEVPIVTANTRDVDRKTQLGGKRKPLNEKSGEIKKAKLTGMKSDVVYLEMEMIHSHNKCPQILQIGLSTAPEKGKTEPRVFMQPVSNPVVENIKVSSTLNSLNLFRAGDKLLFREKSGKKMECKTEKESLQGALSFLQAAKSSYVGPPVTLVTYRNVTIAHFVTALKRQGLQGRFQNIVGSIISLEEIFEEKNVWTLLPMKPLSKVFSSVMGTDVCKSIPLCDEMARNLGLVVTKMGEKHNFHLAEHSKPVQDVMQKFTNLDVALPMELNKYSTENSCNFNSAQPIDAEDDDEIEEIQEIQVVKKAISTPRMKPNRSITGKGTVEVVFRALSFPIYNQPILTELKNAKKSVNFVKVHVSPSMDESAKRNQWNIPTMDALQVHWLQGKAYVLPPVCPQYELSLKNNSHEVKHLEDFKAKTVLGEYEACQGVPLVLQRPLKLVVTKTGKNENINIGPKPTAVMVKFANLSPNVEITPCHTFMVASLEIQGVTVVSRFFGVNANNTAGGKARIVVQTNGKLKALKNGQQIGTAFLVSERNISRVFEEAKRSQDIFATIQDDTKKVEGSIAKGISPKKMLSNLSKEKKICNTVASTRLYARGGNPVLVKLAAKSTDANKFNTVSIQFSSNFKEMIEAARNKQSRGEKVDWKEEKTSKKCRVFWKDSVPYAFLDVTLLSGHQENRRGPRSPVACKYIDLPKAFEISSYVPAESDDEPFVDLSMSVCIDFNERNVVVDDEPKIVEVYLKFKDTEIEKEKVEDQVFFLEGCYNDRVEVLTKVFKTKSGNRLAPQKTSTNDMKAILVMRARYPEDVVKLTGREVIAIAKVASPSVNLVKLCAVSGDGAQEKLPVREADEEEIFDEFGKPEMSRNEGGIERNKRGGRREEEVIEKSDRGMQQRRGRREEEFNEMEIMRMKLKRYEDEDFNESRERGMHRWGGGREEEFNEMGDRGMQQWRGRREEDFDEMEMMRMRMKRYDDGYSGNAGYEDEFNEIEIMRRRMEGLDEGYPTNLGYKKEFLGNGRYDEEYMGKGRYHGEEEYRESRRYEDDMDGGFQARGFQSRFSANPGNYSGGGGGGIDLRGSSVFEKARQKLNLKKEVMDPWM